MKKESSLFIHPQSTEDMGAKCLLRYLKRVCGIKSVGRSITQLPCAGSLHNPWQLQWLVATLFACPHLLQPYSLYLCADQGF
jgi:hypothetical protein